MWSRWICPIFHIPSWVRRSVPETMNTASDRCEAFAHTIKLSSWWRYNGQIHKYLLNFRSYNWTFSLEFLWTLCNSPDKPHKASHHVTFFCYYSCRYCPNTVRYSSCLPNFAWVARCAQMEMQQNMNTVPGCCDILNSYTAASSLDSMSVSEWLGFILGGCISNIMAQLDHYTCERPYAP